MAENDGLDNCETLCIRVTRRPSRYGPRGQTTISARAAAGEPVDLTDHAAARRDPGAPHLPKSGAVREDAAGMAASQNADASIGAERPTDR